MSDFYINKKIDSLGRIVIPKEIRRKLRIVDGENLEVSIADNSIVVKKCSTSELDNRVLYIIESLLLQFVDENAVLFDITGKCYSKENEEMKLDFLEEFVSGKLTESTLKNRIIFPIFIDNSLYGGIVINNDIKEEEKLKMVNILKRFIEKYLEA